MIPYDSAEADPNKLICSAAYDAKEAIAKRRLPFLYLSYSSMRRTSRSNPGARQRGGWRGDELMMSSDYVPDHSFSHLTNAVGGDDRPEEETAEFPAPTCAAEALSLALTATHSSLRPTGAAASTKTIPNPPP